MELQVQVAIHVLHRGRNTIPVSGGYRPLDELGLATITMRLDHQATRKLVGDGRAKVATDQVKAGVQPCGTTRRRNHLTFIDVQDVRVPFNVRKPSPKGLDVPPVGRGPLPVEKAGTPQPGGPERKR